MNGVTPLIVVLKSATLLLGGLITYFSYKAYRRTGASSLRYLAGGFAIVTLGSLLGGLVDVMMDLSRDMAIVTESGLMVLGFSVIVYSLYAK